MLQDLPTADAARPARGRPPGDTAGRILQAAKDIIAQEGVDALRLGAVGARLGISAPAIYAHFPSGRRELVDRVAQDGVEGMLAFFPRDDGPPFDDLMDGVTGLVRFYAENRAFLRIMLLDFSAPDGHPSITREIGKPGPIEDGVFAGMYGRLQRILRSLAEEGRARTVRADVLLNVVLGATTLNLIYPPAPRAAGDELQAEVAAIVRDLVCRYLEIGPEPDRQPQARASARAAR